MQDRNLRLGLDSSAEQGPCRGDDDGRGAREWTIRLVAVVRSHPAGERYFVLE